MKTLSIQTSRPIIEVHTEKATIEIKNRHMRRMKIKTIRPRMKVERKFTPANKNWVKTGARMGQKPLAGFIEYLSGSDLEKLFDPNKIMKDDSAFEDVSKDKVKAHYKALATIREDLAASASEGTGQSFLNPGYLEIDWTTGEVLIEWEECFGPEINVKPHAVVIRVQGDRGVKIRLDEEKLPFNKGKKVNKHV